MKDYYGFDREQLLKAPNIPLRIFENSQAVFREMAREMATEIRKNNEKDRRTVMICPVGPVRQYPYFTELVNRERLKLDQVWILNMDEYLTGEGDWIPKEDSLSFRGFMEREVYGRIDPKLLMPKEQRVFPDPRELSRIPELIRQLGGVDICFGGIGINGHVAFNEADPSMSSEIFLEQSVRILKIREETRAVNAVGSLGGALEDMPHLCVTIGMKEIFGAKKIRLGCFRDWHRGVVRRAAYGERTPEFPVTLLAVHRDIAIWMPESVAEPFR